MAAYSDTTKLNLTQFSLHSRFLWMKILISKTLSISIIYHNLICNTKTFRISAKTCIL